MSKDWYRTPGLSAIEGKFRQLLVMRGRTAMEQNGEPFADFVWSFVNHQPQVTQATTLRQKFPHLRPASDALSQRH